jgi:hypothetical protein
VSGATDRIARLRVVHHWFGERGFGILVTVEDGEYLAHLFRKSSLMIGAPKNGPGTTSELAAESARQRYELEEG